LAAKSKTPRSDLVVRSSVFSGLRYPEYQEQLRFDFWYSCAYCTICEVEATGIGFEIDHYEPRHYRRDLENDYNNLMWSCNPCNRHKSSICPNQDQRALGYRYFRPDQDEYADHFDLQDLLLVKKSNTGDFTIEVLNLNRAMLKRLREIRNNLERSKEFISRGMRALRGRSIDKLPRNLRLQVLVSRSELEGRVNQLNSALRSLCRSSLKDPDPDKKKRSEGRRSFLKKQRAIHPDPWQ